MSLGYDAVGFCSDSVIWFLAPGDEDEALEIEDENFRVFVYDI